MSVRVHVVESRSPSQDVREPGGLFTKRVVTVREVRGRGPGQPPAPLHESPTRGRDSWARSNTDRGLPPPV